MGTSQSLIPKNVTIWAPRKTRAPKTTNCFSDNPGTAQVGAISKAQKQQKDFKVSKYSLLRYRKKPKVEPNWRTRGDTLRFFIHSVANHQKQLKEGHLKKSVSQCRKNWKGGPLGFFSIRAVGKLQKNEGGPLGKNLFFEKKSHRAKNTLREYPLVPLSFLQDVKILLRKLLRHYFKFAK